MAYLVDKNQLIWLTVEEVVDALREVVNYCKNKPTKNLKHAILTLELFLEMKGEILND